MLSLDPGPEYRRVMTGLREKISLKMRERQLIQYWAPKVLPEEFEEKMQVTNE